MTESVNSPNRVRERRIAHGLTQTQLAQRAGISRTAVTAIEGARIIPSVATALGLAAVLECSVEDLFAAPSADAESSTWAWPCSSASGRCWQAEVQGRMIRYPVTSAPFMTPLPDSSIRGTESAASLARDALARDTLVLACCDPAAGFLASQFQAATGLRMIVVPRSSSQAIAMLQKGLVHLAGLHFSTAENPDQNATVVRERLGADFEMIRLSRWQEGIVLSSRCSHRTVGGVLRGELTWVGRENGSGARQCLDRLLQGRRAPRRIAHNHQGVAAAVQSGWADAGVCVQLVSEEAGLRFLPVQQEAFDVCFAKAFAADRRFRAFVNVVRSAAYRNLVGELPGYDVAETGSLSGTL